MRGPRTSVALLVAAVLAAGLRTSAQLVPPTATFPLLESYLESMRTQAGIPGMSAAVVRDEQIVWEKGFGFQNLESRLRATPDTPYLVGDMTEMLAAVLLLQCVEQRRLDLDAPVRRYDLSQPEPDATPRGLLSHTTPPNAPVPFFYSPERYANLTSLVEWCVPQPFRKSVAHRVLRYLAMRDSVPGPDLANRDLELPEGLFEAADLERYRTTLDRMAAPYKVDAKNRAERTEWPRMTISASNGLVSTVRDLAQLDKALDGDGLLLEETREMAWTPAVDRSGRLLPTGLGWFVQTYRNERLVWHFGYVPNAYSSLIVKVPSRQLTFILLANSDGLSAQFDLASGDVTRSPYALLFLRLVK